MKLLDLLFRRPKLSKTDVPDHALLFSVMSDQEWRTLDDLHTHTGIPTPTISARLRELRKKGHVIDLRREAPQHPWLYRLRPRHDVRDETGRFAPRVS